jgi:hypothetical protein
MQTTFRPCTTCPIPFITTCNASGCTINKGKGFVNRTNLSAIKMEKAQNRL